MADLNELFEAISKLKVGVIGDVMLDTYWWGKTERISPEAPVPIVSLNNREQRIGGAGNVALNTVALGASTTLFSVTGKDDDADILISLLNASNINPSNIIKSNERITTNKIRIISRNQQMMRIDAEVSKLLSEQDETELINKIETFIINEKPDVIIFEDYDKGVLKERLIKHIIAVCKSKQIITAADPKRKNFFAYNEVDIFKPNLMEVKDALHLEYDDETSLLTIHKALEERLHHTSSLITLSEKGIFIATKETHQRVPAHVRNVADVSGAGDTVIATAALVYAASRNILLAAQVANIAGGLVCEEVGTAAIKKEVLLPECLNLL